MRLTWGAPCPNHHSPRKGVASLNGFARGGTEAGIPTARGASTWSPMQVGRLLATLSS